MKWLAHNYKWLFDGIGVLVIIGVVGYLLRRFMRAAEPAYHLEQPRQEKTDSRAELRAEDSQVQPERFNPNIRMTGAGVASVSEVDMECGKKTCRVLSKPFSFSSPTKPDRGFQTSGDSLRRH